jgi:hypothetical protein
MNLRSALEPRLDIADSLYASVLVLVEESEGNEEITAQAISKLVGKEVLPESLLEYWSWTDAENLAYLLSLPPAVKVEGIAMEELIVVIERILEAFDSASYQSEAIVDFYLDVIHKNLPCPNASDYIFHKNYKTAEEIAEAIWQYKPILL